MRALLHLITLLAAERGGAVWEQVRAGKWAGLRAGTRASASWLLLLEVGDAFAVTCLPASHARLSLAGGNTTLCHSPSALTMTLLRMLGAHLSKTADDRLLVVRTCRL